MKKQLSQNEIDKLIQGDIERIINKLEFDKINTANRYIKFNKIACSYIQMQKHVELLEKYPDVKMRLISQKFGVFNGLVYSLLNHKDILKYEDKYKKTPYHQELKHFKRAIIYLIDKYNFCQDFEKLIKRNEIQQTEMYVKPDIVEAPEIEDIEDDDIYNQVFVDDTGEIDFMTEQEPEQDDIETNLEEPEELTMEEKTENDTEIINLFNQD